MHFPAQDLAALVDHFTPWKAQCFHLLSLPIWSQRVIRTIASGWIAELHAKLVILDQAASPTPYKLCGVKVLLRSSIALGVLGMVRET
jgi:hypothetical protein